MSFKFTAWEDTAFSRRLTAIISGGLFVIFVFMALFQNSLDNSLFFYLAGTSVIIFMVSLLGKNLPFAFFSNKKQVYLAAAIGLVISIVLGFIFRGGRDFAALSPQPQAIALSLGDLTFFFVNIVAPSLEPLFFFCILFFLILLVLRAMSKAIFKKDHTLLTGFGALLVSRYIFGFYHVATYYQQAGDFLGAQDAILFAAFFGVLYSAGSLLFKSVSFEFGWHFGNNLFTMPYSTAEIFGTIIVAGIAFIAMVEFADRVKVKI